MMLATSTTLGFLASFIGFVSQIGQFFIMPQTALSSLFAKVGWLAGIVFTFGSPF